MNKDPQNLHNPRILTLTHSSSQRGNMVSNIEAGPKWVYKCKRFDQNPDTVPIPFKKSNNPKNEFMADTPNERLMHIDPFSTDISLNKGLNIQKKEIKAYYFKPPGRGFRFAGMSPTYLFPSNSDELLICPAFGREKTDVLLFNYKENKIKSSISIPGRNLKMAGSVRKENRSKIFKSTFGGAYSYVDNKNRIVMPIVRKTKTTSGDFGKFTNLIIWVSFDEKKQEFKGYQSFAISNFKEFHQHGRINAVMPDAKGNIWFTLGKGLIGCLKRVSDDKYELLPPFILNYERVSKNGKLTYKETTNSHSYKIKNNVIIPRESGINEAIEKNKLTNKVNSDFLIKCKEKIQNSFSVDKEGNLYIITNFALYKFTVQDNKIISAWDLEKYYEPDSKLVYNNSYLRKAGHVSNGSGTTPTLFEYEGEKFVAWTDNDVANINLCVAKQSTGEVIAKKKLIYEKGKMSTCENSLVINDNNIIVANSSGYAHPFKEKKNKIVNGVKKMILTKTDGDKWDLIEDPVWLKNGSNTLAQSTATPKASAPDGTLTLYNKPLNKIDDEKNIRWGISIIDYETGKCITSFIPDKELVKDEESNKIKEIELTKRKIKATSNLWGTYSFTPNRGILIGARYGFIFFK